MHKCTNGEIQKWDNIQIKQVHKLRNEQKTNCTSYVYVQKCKNEGMYTCVQMAQKLNKEMNKRRTAEVRKYREAR